MNGFLIDTNVVSEFAKPEPTLKVIHWLRTADPDSLYTSTIVFGQVWLGIENLPAGKRRSSLEEWVETGLPDWFDTNHLPVTRAIARRWARLTIEAKRKGLSIGTADGLIAATALEHDLVLVTRDIGDFAGVTIPILNPWDT